jgi:hypothetical protein
MATSLITAVSTMISAANNIRQGFENVSSISQTPDISNMSTGQIITFILVFLLSIWILMCIGASIFNTTIPKIIPSIGKVTIMQFFGLYIVTHILFT